MAPGWRGIDQPPPGFPAPRWGVVRAGCGGGSGAAGSAPGGGRARGGAGGGGNERAAGGSPGGGLGVRGAGGLPPPPYLNREATYRPLSGEADWGQAAWLREIA